MSLDQKCKSLKTTTLKALEETQELKSLSNHVLTQVVLESIRLYQKKVVVGIEDSASDLLDQFKQNVAKQIFELASGWKVSYQDCFLFPKGCRFSFQKGRDTVIVVEQDPQVRTLSFMQGMQQQTTPVKNKYSERICLSLPYTIFVFSFNDDTFKDVKCFWTTSPLKSLDDNLCCCVLPNIHIGGSVCLSKQDKIGSINNVCEKVISSFWSSQFNSDLSDQWLKKGSVSSLISTGKLWEEKTREDPLFILNVPFKKYKTLRDVLYGNTSDVPVTQSVFKNKVFDQIDSCIENLFHKISNYLKKTKFEKHVPKDIEDLMKNTLKSSISELVDVVVSLDCEIEKLSLSTKPKDEKPVSAGFYWNYGGDNA